MTKGRPLREAERFWASPKRGPRRKWEGVAVFMGLILLASALSYTLWRLI